MVTVSARQLDSLLNEWRGSGAAYLDLADRIRLLALDGRLAVGSRMPAERQLADRLGVSRTTVSATYSALRDGGYLSSVQGSGSVVHLPGRSESIDDADVDADLDLRKAVLPAVPHVAESAMRAARELPSHLSDAGFDPWGLPRLRAAIADRYTARGVPTTPDEVMVTVGAQHAIALLARVLVERGDRVLVESPSYPHAFEALREAGGRLVGINVNADGGAEGGWDTAVMDQVFPRSSPAVAYVMPDFHNPTGQVMSSEVRERVSALADRHGTVLIADETMAELDIDGPDPLLPLAGYGPAVLIGSLGKTVWGGLRIGWIRAETPLIRKLVRARLAIDLGTPILEQLIAADLLGSYDEILALRRGQLRAGRDHLERSLATAIPEWRVPHVTGGLTTWVALGAPVSSALTIAARREGLLLAAGPLFGVDGAFERFIRIPFTLSEHDMDTAIQSLSRAWAGLSRLPAHAPDALESVI